MIIVELMEVQMELREKIQLRWPISFFFYLAQKIFLENTKKNSFLGV